jgi:hypothetical protein
MSLQITRPQITQRGPSRNQSDTIHEPTRNNTNQVSCDLNFVLVRVISWIVSSVKTLFKKLRSFAIASQITQILEIVGGAENAWWQ